MCNVYNTTHLKENYIQMQEAKKSQLKVAGKTDWNSVTYKKDQIKHYCK